ncbi:MAG: hypothetical protein JSS32_02335 [Verrucomicrobia bacterium]|nr:hypothetical protein [Verrucomicrobiota bacterium]
MHITSTTSHSFPKYTALNHPKSSSSSRCTRCFQNLKGLIAYLFHPRTTLLEACKSNSPSTLRGILLLHKPTEKQIELGMFEALQKGNEEGFLLLAQKYPNIPHNAKTGETFLHYLLSPITRNESLALKLIETGIYDVQAKYDGDKSTLSCTAGNFQPSPTLCRALFNAGVKPTPQDINNLIQQGSDPTLIEDLKASLSPGDLAQIQPTHSKEVT